MDRSNKYTCSFLKKDCSSLIPYQPPVHSVQMDVMEPFPPHLLLLLLLLPPTLCGGGCTCDTSWGFQGVARRLQAWLDSQHWGNISGQGRTHGSRIASSQILFLCPHWLMEPSGVSWTMVGRSWQYGLFYTEGETAFIYPDLLVIEVML